VPTSINVVFRVPSSTSSSSQDSDNWSHQSSDDVKQFNMSYNKISPEIKDGLDVTKHVTQLRDTPGFTCFIDEPLPIPSPKMQPEKRTSSPKKQSSGNVVRKQSKHQPVEPVSEYKYFKTSENDLKIHHARVSSPSASRDRLANHTTSESVPAGFSSTYFDEEIDVNSAAYVSVAALRKAIEKAQETIRIAKESVSRKKKGLKSFSKKTSKNSSTVEGNIDDVLPTYIDGKKLFAAKKVIDEMNGKISESTKEHSKPKDDTTVSSSTGVTGQSESRPLESVENHENTTLSSESIGTEKSRAEPSDFMHENETDDMFVNDYQDRIEVTKPTIGILEHHSDVKELESAERVEDDMAIEMKEIKDEVILSNAQELSNELDTLTVSQKVEDEYKVSQGLLENEKQKEVLEREHVESDKGIDEASEWSESENEFIDDDNVEIHKEVKTSEMLYNVCEVETNEKEQTCDDITENSKESVEKFDNISEEHDDREMEHEENHTAEKTDENLGNTSDQEFDDKSSCDDNDVEETDSINGIHDFNVDMNDNDVETTQEVDDVARYSSEYQVEDTDLSASDTDDDNLREVTSDDLADLGSDDTGFGQHETEENDVKSESSSGTIHGMKLEEEESNTQVPHNAIPGIESTKLKASEEPINETDKKDEIKESEKDYSRRIDEMTAKRNRLAVERAVREARERAFAEARKRAERERAAVEKATEEVRQRMMADVLEKATKASAGTQSSSERSSEWSKRIAERAAVERATLEARHRALEKAVSQKTAADLNSSESALRAKAKLEKHNRIMERAAKALAEKEKRDLLAAKEQAERNRLAENVDADIKRWSNGKEKNLRLLLSTLQYILGPESGWQPISLTDIASSAAVKKAYRKATLCVHPDKLQQRGASIQQKYICEKVFDLLKAAWNRFNSEEK
ncbi:auxilin-like protein 1, partial [Tanacetum coccineum]